MGIYITGDEWAGFVLEPSAFLTLLHPSGTNAFKFTSANLTPKEEREPRNEDDRGTHSRGPTRRGRKSGELSITCKLRPSGSLGVLSDTALFEKHCFGAQVVTGGVNVVNSFVRHPEDTLFGLSVHFMADFAAWHVRGFVVQSIKYSGESEGDATMEISGQAAEIIQTGPSTLLAALATGASSFQPQADEITNFSKDSKVDVGSSIGHVVTAEPTGGIVSVTPNIVGAQAIAAAVLPTIISGSTVGSPISGIAGDFSLDAATVQSISHTVTIQANRDIRNKDWGSKTPTGFFSGKKRDVTFESQIYLSKPSFKYITGAQKLTQYDLQLIFGDTPGSRLKIDMNKVEMDIPPVETNNDDEAVVSVSGYALPTGVEDECTATYD